MVIGLAKAYVPYSLRPYSAAAGKWKLSGKAQSELQFPGQKNRIKAVNQTKYGQIQERRCGNCRKTEMEVKDILRTVDHTLLKQESTWEEIRHICEDAMHYQTCSVCIPASYVKQAAEYMADRPDRVLVCTVIGFPNGYSTTAAKAFEAADAVANGADEIDMVINVGFVKDHRDDELLAEINAVKEACAGRVLKVIIETCLLSEEEKIRMCRIVSASNADFIKTSTGFSTAGATFEDIALMKAHMKEGKGIKAAGGIASLEDAEKFLSLGATRLGTSRIVKIIKGQEAAGY